MTAEMREPTFFILSSLLGGRKHGYAIMTDALELSNGEVKLQVGTLYAALERLVGVGLACQAGEEVVAGRNRRYYAITDEGVAALETETSRIQARAFTAAALLAQRREGYAL